MEMTKFPCRVFGKILIPYSRSSRISISCFLEDVGPIFKISKNLSDSSSGFTDTRFFGCNINVRHYEISPNSIFFKIVCDFLALLVNLVGPKLNNWFRKSLSEKYEHERLSGFLEARSKSY